MRIAPGVTPCQWIGRPYLWRQSPTTSTGNPMLRVAKAEWRRIKRGTPGRRFQDRRQAVQRGPARRGQKLFHIGGGIIVIMVGLILIPAPGPGWAVTILGFGLLAREIGAVARGLDWTEVQLRRFGRTVRDWWRQASIAGRVGIATVALAGVVAAGYLAARVAFGG